LTAALLGAGVLAASVAAVAAAARGGGGRGSGGGAGGGGGGGFGDNDGPLSLAGGPALGSRSAVDLPPLPSTGGGVEALDAEAVPPPPVGRRGRRGGVSRRGSGHVNVVTLPSAVARWSPGGIEYPGAASRSVLLVNGTAEDAISWTFFAEPNRTLDDYVLVQRSSDPGVLHATEDTEVAPVSNGDGISFNATVAFAFDRMPGVTTYAWELRRKADNSLYDAHSVSFVVAGLAIYGTLPGSSTPVLYTGTDNALDVDYKDLLGDGNRTLYAFAQYLNGTNSTAALGPTSESVGGDGGGTGGGGTGGGGGVDPNTQFSLADLTSTVTANRKVIDHDPTKCGATAGNLAGNSRVDVDDGCGFAFAADGSTGAVLFGLAFNEYRAGPVAVAFEWDRFTAGSEFAGELYTTTLNVNVRGNPPVVVTAIDEDVPHSPAGGEALTVTVFNSVNRPLQAFRVPGAAADFVLRNGSVVIHGAPDYYETAVFETAPGSGKNLSWLLLTVEPDGGNGAAAGGGANGSATAGGNGSAAGGGNGTTADGGSGAAPDNGTGGGSNDVAIGGSSIPSAAVDRTRPPFRFDYAGTDLQFADGSPPSGDVAGGFNRTLVGNFTGWDPSRGDALLFSSGSLDPSWTVSWTEESLTFTVPPQQQVGKGLVYDISVVMNSVFSNAIEWTYTAGLLNVKIVPFGTSMEVPAGTNASNTGSAPRAVPLHVVPRCGDSTYVAIVRGANPSELSYQWYLRNGAGVDVLGLTATNHSTLVVDNAWLATLDSPHTLSLEVKTLHGGGRAGLDLVRRRYTPIGVTLMQPETRTVAHPEVGLRVIARVQLPSCYEGMPEVLYDWTYDRGDGTVISARMSSSNQSMASDAGVTAARLGRELIVPQADLLPGVHDVMLFTSIKDDPVVNGTALIAVTINASPLVPMIGSGAQRVQLSGNESHAMVGTGSHDPDLLDGNQAQYLRYHWDCRIQDRETGDFSMPCPADMLPSPAPAVTLTPDVPTPAARRVVVGRSVQPNDTTAYRMPGTFVVPQQALSATRLFNRSVFIRYELAVQDERQPGRVSPPVTQELELLPIFDVTVSSFTSVAFRNARGEAVDATAIKAHDELIVSPQADDGVTWEFSLLPPHADLLRMPGALLTRPGYWSPGQDNAFVRRPLLGFQAGALMPRTSYRLQVEFFGSSTESGEAAVATEPNRVLFDLVVGEVAHLYLVPLDNFVGTTEKQWHLSAISSFATPDVLFFFYLIDADGKEVCVDGCTGSPQASFRVLRPGEYRVLVRLVAASGLSVLDFVEQPQPLIIREDANHSRSLAAHSRSLLARHLAGDDGSYLLDAMYLTESLTAEESSGEVIAMAAGADEEHEQAVSSAVQEMVDRVVQISALSIPTTAFARNLVTAAATFAAMDLKHLPDENTLYRLVAIATNAIERTPDSESLEVLSTRRSNGASLTGRSAAELGGVVTEFYDRLVELSLRRSAGGSTRSRLLPRLGDANTLLLDLMELRRQQVTAVTTKDKSCGFTQTLRMGSVADTQLSSELVETLGSSAGSSAAASSLTVAVMCNAEQGLYLKGDLGAAFGWCPAVYGRGAERKVISIAETFDYVYLSGIRPGEESRSESSKLVSVDIDELSSGNRLRAAPRVALGTVQPHRAGSTARPLTRASSFCYSVTLPMDQQLMARADGCSTLEAYSLAPVKQLNDGVQGPGAELYGRNFRSLSNAATVGDVSVVASSDRLGLFGARRADCNTVLPVFGDELQGVVLNALLMIGLLCGIVFLLLVASACTYVAVTTYGDGASEQGAVAVANWVERDFYGRTDIRLDLDTQSRARPSAAALGMDGGVAELGVAGAPAAAVPGVVADDPTIFGGGSSESGTSMLARGAGGGAGAVVIPVGNEFGVPTSTDAPHGVAARDGVNAYGMPVIAPSDAASDTSAMEAFAGRDAGNGAVSPVAPPVPLVGVPPTRAMVVTPLQPSDVPVAPPLSAFAGTSQVITPSGTPLDASPAGTPPGATSSRSPSSAWETPPRVEGVAAAAMPPPLALSTTTPPPPPPVDGGGGGGSLTASPPPTPPPMPAPPTPPGFPQ